MWFCMWKSTISENFQFDFLRYSLIGINSEKFEFWVPFYVKKVPFWSPFCSKLGPLWVPFLQFLGPLEIWEQCIPNPIVLFLSAMCCQCKRNVKCLMLVIELLSSLYHFGFRAVKLEKWPISSFGMSITMISARDASASEKSLFNTYTGVSN